MSCINKKTINGMKAILLCLIYSILLPTPLPSSETQVGRRTNGAKSCPFRFTKNYQGMSVSQLIKVAYGSINRFWASNVPNKLGKTYYPPNSFNQYSAFQLISTKCGRAVPNNAFYCSLDHSISYDIDFLTNAYQNIGDYALVAILAHEWGHLVQAHLYSNGAYFSIQMELQADACAGAYTQYALQTGLLEQGDLEEGALNTYNSGDNSPWFASGAHGSPQQRYNAFMKGYQYGISGCF
jgi:uncharacterized protein